MTDVLRTSALGLAATALALGLSACGGSDGGSDSGSGGGIDKTAFVAKMKAEPDLKDIPEKTLTCLADAAIKYGDKDSIQGYLDGSVKSVDDIKGLGKENKEAEQAGAKCVE
ncbi:hypothetical protein IMZ11_31010 [Microtetraspora sp. AC03309]|uniref:hypothetical protein n=1 Tax=Microtetraspora sp. AC03309 TaxID=2779376 RepID=UPI001E50E389|nr:hypothetical protein [Microtetraspora sp. AC03309]MCC5580063.1 hypothetical protein [Microtetraspora sp. AC03309]